MIRREGIGDAMLPHDLNGDAVGERPSLVHASLEQSHRAFQDLCVKRDDRHLRIVGRAFPKVDRGWPQGSVRVVESVDLPPLAASQATSAGIHYFYMRLKQVDGNMAWASPIWIAD